MVWDASLIYFLLVIGFSGFFGGIVSVIFEMYHFTSFQTESAPVQDCNECKWKFAYWFNKSRIGWTFLGRGLIGIAGAFGIILLGLWVGKIKLDLNVSNEIFIIGLAMLSGTMSYSLLPKIGHKLEEQVIKAQIQETKKEAAEESRKAVDFSAAVSAAETALNRNEIPDMPHAIQMLESMRPKFPTNRILHIYLGRLYRKVGDLKKAILVLRDLISNLEKERSQGTDSRVLDIDIAAAYYNIACYHILMAKGNSGDEKNRLISEGIDNLKISIKRDDKGIGLAKSDADFDYIRQEPAFKDLVASNEEI